MTLSYYSNSQKDTLDISTYTVGADLKTVTAFSKQFKNKQTFNYFKDYNGNVYKIGDKFKLGIPQKVQGALTNTHFLTLYAGDAISINIPATDYALNPSLKVPGHNWSGAECIVTKIGVRKEFGVALPFVVFSSQGTEISTSSIDNSLLAKELIDPNAPMSSEEAISKLKALKEKLDLELITKQEYDAQKNELAKFIK